MALIDKDQVKSEARQQLEDYIYNALAQSYEDKLKTLPPPPEGFYYAPVDVSEIKKKGDLYVVDITLELTPIIEDKSC
jgi:hypothetical protein